MLIFKQKKIIPEFCFGCYKVQVEVNSIIELIKLFLVFNNLELENNNTRKCMIEMRPEIPGFYKGLIYCSSLDEAYQIADYLEPILKENIAYGLSTRVKRGCSAEGGSSSKTSSPQPAIWPVSMAALSATSSMRPPRAQLITRAP